MFGVILRVWGAGKVEIRCQDFHKLADDATKRSVGRRGPVAQGLLHLCFPDVEPRRLEVTFYHNHLEVRVVNFPTISLALSLEITSYEGG